jgi:hypothetical protein
MPYQPYSQMYNPTPTTPQAQPGGMEVVSVQNVSQVEQISVQPGQRRLVMVQNEPVIAARVADQMGLVSTEYYQLVKFTPTTGSAVPVSGDSEFITRKEFNEFVAKITQNTGKETES